MNKESKLNMKVSKSIFKFISKCIKDDVFVDIIQEREVNNNGEAIYLQDKYRFTFIVNAEKEGMKYKTARQINDEMINSIGKKRWT